MRNKFFIIWVLFWMLDFQLLNGSIIAISIPKCGTHFLFKVINLITPKLLSYKAEKIFCRFSLPIINSLGSNGYYGNHAIYISDNIKALENRSEIKKFFMIRDPRDQIVSMAHCIQGDRNIFVGLFKIIL